jgi:hypothetical protein
MIKIEVFDIRISRWKGSKFTTFKDESVNNIPNISIVWKPLRPLIIDTNDIQTPTP